MSSGITSSTQRISGLVSGMDVDSIVKNLMKAESAKQEKIKQDKQVLVWRQEDYRSINTTLRSFRDKVFDMKMQAAYLVNKSTSSNESVVKVTAGTSAVEGIYTLNKVTSLASGASITSGEVKTTSDTSTSTVTSATTMEQLGLTTNTTVTIANGTKSAELQIKTTDTIASLVNNINSLKDADGDSLGMKVSFDDNLHRFFMMSTGTGSEQKITMTDNDTNFLQNKLMFTTLEDQGDDAKVTLNNVDLTFASNQFTVSGVTYNLLSTTDTATTITVSKDTDAIVSSIKDFVSSYNDTISELNDKLSEDRYSDYSPLTDEQKEAMSDTQQEQWEEKAKSGLLRSDSLLQGVVNTMRSSLYTQVAGMGSSEYTTLSSIGITTGTYLEKGKLYIDEDKLKEAINNDLDAVMNLFTKTSDTTEEKGLAARLYDDINKGMTSISSKAGSSSSLVDNSYIGKRITEFDEQIDDWDTRLADIQERYYKQFDAMEQALSKLNSQSSWLAQQFASN